MDVSRPKLSFHISLSYRRRGLSLFVEPALINICLCYCLPAINKDELKCAVTFCDQIIVTEEIVSSVNLGRLPELQDIFNVSR